VGNVYIGDAMKFRDRCYAPSLPAEGMSEWRGTELEERLDPSVEEEAAWLEKVEVNNTPKLFGKLINIELGSR